MLTSAFVNQFRHSFDSAPTKALPLLEALEAIHTGTYQRQVEYVRRVLGYHGKAAYDKAKANLPAVTFAGTFHPTRSLANLQAHSGVVHGDLDHLHDVEAVKHAIAGDSHTSYVFTSPSGTGLKLGVRVDPVTDGSSYKHAWQVVAIEYARRYSAAWDPSGKDISRLCYVSYDPDLYVNPNADVFDVPPPPPPAAPPPPQAYPTPPRTAEDGRWYAEQAIRTAVQMIQSAPLGTRHWTRLRAARLLGGFVGGGLLSEDEAYRTLEGALVGHTEDLKQALKTVEDGLRYGQAAPFSLDALEAERQAWIQAHRSSRHDTLPSASEDDSWEATTTFPLRPFTASRTRALLRRAKGVHHA